MSCPDAGHDRRRGEGQALVEFALVAPIFFLLVFGIIQLGLLLAAQNGLVSAVRETARMASTFRVGDTADSTLVCTTYVKPFLDERLHALMPGFTTAAPQTKTVTYHWVANPADTGSYFIEIHVDVSYAYPLYVPLVSAILDNATPHPSNMLAASEQMRIENQPIAYTRSDVSC